MLPTTRYCPSATFLKKLRENTKYKHPVSSSMASASDLLKCLNLKCRSSPSGNNVSRRLSGVAFATTRTVIRLLQMEEAMSDSFYTGKNRSLPRSTPSRTTSCLNLSGFPHAQYVQPHTGHTQSHPTAICTHPHPMLAAGIVSPGAHIASQTANARLAAPNTHSTNQRLSFLPNTNPRTISAKPSKAANTIIQKPIF